MFLGKKNLFKGYTGRILIIVSLGWAITQTGRFLLPPLLPAIMEEVNISVFVAGIILTIMQIVYALAQYPSGKLSDMSNRSVIIIPGMLVIALSFFLLAGVNTASILVISVAALGLGRAMYNIPSRALISDLFSSKRGEAMGIFTAGSDLGGIVAGGISVALVAVYGFFIIGEIPNWRVVMFFWGLVALLLVVLFKSQEKEALNFKFEGGKTYEILNKIKFSVKEDIQYILGGKSQRETILAFAFFIFVATAVVNFLPLYLIEEKGFSLRTSGSIFGWFFLLGMIVKPIIGGLSDRLPRYLISMGGLAVSTVGIGLLIMAQSVIGVVVAVAIFAIGYKGQFPVIDAILMDGAPDNLTGSYIGAARTVFFTLGGIGAAYMGWMGQYYNFQIGFIGLGLALVIAIILLYRNY